MYIFGGLKANAMWTLGNTKSYECGRSRDFGVTQRSFASTIYTSCKDVRIDFGLDEESNLLS